MSQIPSWTPWIGQTLCAVKYHTYHTSAVTYLYSLLYAILYHSTSSAMIYLYSLLCATVHLRTHHQQHDFYIHCYVPLLCVDSSQSGVNTKSLRCIIIISPSHTCIYSYDICLWYVLLAPTGALIVTVVYYSITSAATFWIFKHFYQYI